jgi:hypothetical protein
MKEPEITTMQVERDTLQKIRVLAAMEGETTREYINWLINKAYESKLINHQASARVKKAISNV